MDGTAERDRAKVCFSLRRDGHDCRRLIRTRGEMEWGKEIEKKKKRNGNADAYSRQIFSLRDVVRANRQKSGSRSNCQHNNAAENRAL